jgi:drug/metabolite transporter (DMT)-like permease
VDSGRHSISIILDSALFRDIPNDITMLGAAIVIGSTLYITIREVKMGAKKVPASDE